jgi:hypothetical protein
MSGMNVSDSVSDMTPLVRVDWQDQDQDRI